MNADAQPEYDVRIELPEVCVNNFTLIYLVFYTLWTGVNLGLFLAWRRSQREETPTLQERLGAWDR